MRRGCATRLRQTQARYINNLERISASTHPHRLNTSPRRFWPISRPLQRAESTRSAHNPRMHPSKPPSSSISDRARSHFATLEPRIRNISQSTIQKKWKPLPTNSQDKIRQILLNVKTKRCGSTARIPPLGKAPRRRSAKANPKTQVKEEEYDQIVEEIADKYVGSFFLFTTLLSGFTSITITRETPAPSTPCAVPRPHRVTYSVMWWK